MLLLLFCHLRHKWYLDFFLIIRIYFQLLASSGKLELECNPQLSTTTTITTKYSATVTSRNPGLSHSHNSGNTTGNNGKTPAMPGKTSTGDHTYIILSYCKFWFVNFKFTIWQYVCLPKIAYLYNSSLCIYAMCLYVVKHIICLTVLPLGRAQLIAT